MPGRLQIFEVFRDCRNSDNPILAQALFEHLQARLGLGHTIAFEATITDFVDGLVEGARNWELVLTLGIHCAIGALVGMAAVALVKIVSTI